MIYDLCGTILNSKSLDHEAINYTLKKYNKESWYIIKKKKNPAKSMKENFPNFFGSQFQEAYDTYINYLTNNINKISLFENVYEHFRILKLLHIKSAIITNRDKKFVEALAKNQEFQRIVSYIDLIVSSDDIGHTKPSPLMIEHTIKKLGEKKVQNKDIFLVGDAFADMSMAVSYGCTPILLTATPSDITEQYLSDNNLKIYMANSYQEINRSLMFCFSREKEYKNLSKFIISNHNSI